MTQTILNTEQTKFRPTFHNPHGQASAPRKPVASHLHPWCHVDPSLQDGDAGRGNRRMRRQCWKTPGMGITRPGWSRSMAGVHCKRLGRGHKILLVCTKGGREGNRPQHLNPVHSFRGCLAPKHSKHP